MNPSSPVAERLERFQGYLQTDPGNLRLRADLFELAMQLPDYALAQEQLTFALESDPLDHAWRWRQAKLYVQQAQYVLAERILGELIADGADEPGLHCDLGRCLFRHGKFEQAAGQLRPLVDTALAQAPDALELWLRCQHRLGQLDTAADLFAAHAHEVELVPAAWGVASLLAFDAEQLGRARDWAGHALRLAPTQREAMVTMGTQALAQQDSKHALRYLEKCVALYPRELRAWSALGIAYMLAMRLRDAVAVLEHAIVLAPDYINSWHALGWSQLCLKEPVSARASFEQALELDRNFAESHGGLAVTLAVLGQRELATQHAERALRLDRACLSARFAQALLNGEGLDPATFQAMARRVLGQSRTVAGGTIADAVLGTAPDAARAP
jgi:tetratricopeptide (TPR) repeat protein